MNPRTERVERAPGDESSSTALRYRRSERTALYIETQEGDVVRLKIKVRTALTAETETGSNGDRQVSEVSLTSRSTVKISFSVDGDLNADELAALRSVVEQASGLAAEFFAGGASEAFATAAGLEIDGAQLARVGLRMSLREHLTYSASGTIGPALPLAVPPPDEPIASESVAAPAEESPLPTDEAEAAPAAEPAPADTAPEPEAGAAGEPPVGLPTPALDTASTALATIASFLTTLLESLAAPAPIETGADAPSIELSLKLRVFQSVTLSLAATQQTPAEEPGLPLLTDTLEALALESEPLDTAA